MNKTSLFPLVALVIAVMILSQAGNLIRLCDADPLAITFFRLIIALLLLFPVFLRELSKASLRELKATDWFAWIGMGFLFAIHFVLWITSVQKTTVANAAVFFSTSPLFAAIGAKYFLKETLHPNIYLTFLLGFLGMGIIGFKDFSFNLANIAGDLLALAGGIVFAGYLLVGKKLRQTCPNLVMMCGVYSFGILFILPLMLAKGLSFSNYSPKTWIGFSLLAVFPTILGHATVIYVMRFFKASTVSTAFLAEPVLAGIVAFFAFSEPLALSSVFGYGMIATGLILLFREPQLQKVG